MVFLIRQSASAADKNFGSESDRRRIYCVRVPVRRERAEHRIPRFLRVAETPGGGAET